MSSLTKAISLTGAACSIWFQAVRRRNGGSQGARIDLRNAYFRAHSKIREEPVHVFCDRIRQPGARASDSLQVPVACTESMLGGPGYYVALASAAAARRPRQIVEFGTYLGAGTMVLALNSPEARVLTIDLPDEAPDISHLNTVDRQHVEASRNRVGQCYRGRPCESRITELKLDSRGFRLRDVVDSVDLILIDGGHDTECITADTLNALSVAREGSVILWDDYFWLYPDVVQYLDGLSDRLELVRLGGTCLVAHVVGGI